MVSEASMNSARYRLAALSSHPDKVNGEICAVSCCRLPKPCVRLCCFGRELRRSASTESRTAPVMGIGRSSLLIHKRCDLQHAAKEAFDFLVARVGA